jgi:hypothetical protein
MPLQPLSMLYIAKPARTERAALYAPFPGSGCLVPGECRSGKNTESAITIAIIIANLLIFILLSMDPQKLVPFITGL